MERAVSRRAFLAGVAGTVAASRIARAQDVPTVTRLVNPEDGRILREIQTDALHASGITYGNDALWIGSTKGKNAQDPPKTLKVDPRTGKTLKSWITPGSGLYGRMSAERGDTPSGAHGLKWIDGKYWMAVPASHTWKL